MEAQAASQPLNQPLPHFVGITLSAHLGLRQGQFIHSQGQLYFGHLKMGKI